MKKDNTKREVTLKFSVPKTNTMFYTLLALIGIYSLLFLIVNSYAQSNGLTKRSITNPVGWFKANPTLTPTPTLIPTVIPTATVKPVNTIRKAQPTLKPTQQITQQTNNQEVKFEQVVIPHLGKTYYCDTRYIAGVLKTSNDFVDLRNRALNNANDLGSRWGAVCSMKPQAEQEQCLKDSGVYETAKKFDEILNEQEKRVMAVINYACKQQ